MSETFPSKATVRRLRTNFPAGTRVELLAMSDPWSDLKPGARGTVHHTDDIGTIFVHWDNGSGLGVVHGVDRIRKI